MAADRSALLARSIYSPGSTSSTHKELLIDGTLTAQLWSHLGVADAIWLILPLSVGLAIVGRAGFK
jgi:hypothetical protein